LGPLSRSEKKMRGVCPDRPAEKTTRRKSSGARNFMKEY
jgi:hypothetical protein